MVNKIICKVCGFEALILTSHIKAKHKLTTAQYKLLYPNSRLVSQRPCKWKGKTKDNCEQLRVQSNSQKASLDKIKKDNPEEWHKRYTLNNNFKNTNRTTDEYKQKISTGVKKALLEGKIQTVEARITRGKAISLSIKNKKENGTYDIVRKNVSDGMKKYFATDAGRLQQSKNGSKRAQKYYNMLRKLNITTSEYLGAEKYDLMRQRQSDKASLRPTMGNSIAELEINDFLLKNNFVFLHDTKMKFTNFSCKPDFRFEEKKKIIEYNGCYWHGCQTCCPNVLQDTKKHFRANQTINNYNKKIKMYEKYDYRLLEIWEHEWKENRENVFNKIRKFLES